ncbi:fatty acid 2-hydroxylase [Biomphalaria pfeifferi]|uniref:Fatty acid 2-hydroxylase n=1 Tax=Biomphalaria pfeifferi TaxID=112525 RepID=A0AAD8FGT3_BIOPF|nr:fatty acid 2-hydroxylase [Biomphalaria pfeifferi]
MGLPDTNGQHRPVKIRVTRKGKLYDLTEFVDRHPGGREILERHNGLDIEAAMQNSSVHAHSKAAYTMLERYAVGTTDTSAQQNELLTEIADKGRADYKKNDIVDWSKPILGQVEFLGEKYFDWTHQPVDWPVRLFESDLAETFSKAYWWFVPVTWVPVVLYMIWSSFQHLSHVPEVWPQNALAIQHGPLSMPFLFAFGVLMWTFLEYFIHRWIFHLRPPPNWPSLIRLHFALHGQHHKSPMDPMRLVFPPLPASFFAVPFYFMSTSLFPVGLAQITFAGIVSGYMLYDLIHYYLHHGKKPFLAYFQQLKSYHNLHHYKYQQLGFGISSKFWDYPFGTLIPENPEKNK